MIEGACLMGSTGANLKWYDAGFRLAALSPAFSFFLDLDTFLAGIIGNMVFVAASVAIESKLLHFVIMQRRNSLCKWT